MPSIHISEGPLKGKIFDLESDKELVLGRDKNNALHVPDRKLSRRHCAFGRTPEGILLSDLKSTNGTYVNGQRIRDKLLADGDLIKVGLTEMEFKAAGGGRRAASSGIDAKSSRIRFCSGCGVSIPVRDIQSGKAKEAGPRIYCASCARKRATDRASSAPRKKKDYVPSYARQSTDHTDTEMRILKKEVEALIGKPAGAPGDEEETMRSLVSRVVRGRAHQQALDVVTTQRITNIDPDDLASLSGVEVREVEKVLEDWKVAGLVKSFAGAPYQLAPTRSDAEALKTFARLWLEPSWRDKLIGWILAEEARA